jgi:copper chaperone
MSEGTKQHSYTVEGMTCAHCVAAVTQSVGALPGAEDVHVDLDSGLLEVRGEDVDDDAVREAVQEAGYSLA